MIWDKFALSRKSKILLCVPKQLLQGLRAKITRETAHALLDITWAIIGMFAGSSMYNHIWKRCLEISLQLVIQSPIVNM